MKRIVFATLATALVLSTAFAYGPRFQNAQPATNGAGTAVAPIRAGTVFAGTLHDEAAALLGLTPEELIALHQDGKTLADIAAELGQDATAFRASLIDARNAAIDEAVQSGELTEAQAAVMKTRTEAAVDAQLQREVGPNAAFAYGPARGAQAFGQRTGRAVGPAGAPNGYGFGPGAMNAPAWQNGANAMPNRPMGRMGGRW